MQNKYYLSNELAVDDWPWGRIYWSWSLMANGVVLYNFELVYDGPDAEWHELQAGQHLTN